MSKRGSNRKPGAPGLPGAGRPKQYVTIRITPANAATAQRLMLHFPQVPTVEALYEYALKKLAETTDD